jgi:hypothetical protein
MLEEPPVGSRPALKKVDQWSSSLSCPGTDSREEIDLPSIPSTVHSRKRHTAVGDLEEGLVLQVQGAQGAAGDCLGEAYDGIVVDGSAAFERCGEGC